MASPSPQLMSLAEFLTWDDGTDRRYELVRGRPLAMAPPSAGYRRMVSNLISMLRERVEGPDRIIAAPRLVPPHRSDTCYRPDIAISGAALPRDSHRLFAPMLLIQVLPEPTPGQHRVAALPDYRTIPTVREILALRLNEKRAEIWQRLGECRWSVQDLTGDAVLQLSSVAAELPLAAIYEGIDLSPQTDATAG